MVIGIIILKLFIKIVYLLLLIKNGLVIIYYYILIYLLIVYQLNKVYIFEQYKYIVLIYLYLKSRIKRL